MSLLLQKPDLKAPRWGFTLIELLVVLAVIAILAVLLFPALKHIREFTNRVKCVSNLRVIGGAIAAYTSENNGTYPNLWVGQWGGAPFWVDHLEPYLPDPYPGSYRHPDGRPTSNEVFYCPSVKLHGPLSDYGANANIMPWTTYPPVKVVSVSKPSQRIVLCDASDFFGEEGTLYVDLTFLMNDPKAGKTQNIGGVYPTRHAPEIINALFCDGHVESLNFEKFSENRLEYFGINGF